MTPRKSYMQLTPLIRFDMSFQMTTTSNHQRSGASLSGFKSKTITGGYSLTDEEIEELADLLDEADRTVTDMIGQLKKIQKALKPLLDKMFTWEE